MSDKQICGVCGKVHVTYHGHASCSAHKSNTDPIEPCTKPPKAGMSVCRSHGGALPVNVRAAQERLALMSAEGEIAQLMREVDIPDQHPIDGLLEVVRVSGAMMRLLTIKVGELAEDPSVEEVLVEKNGDLSTKRVAGDDAFWGLNHQGEMTPHIYVTLLRIWTERYERACKTALEAGIEERLVRNAEQTSNVMFTAVQAALSQVQLSPDQKAVFVKALAGELQRFAGGTAKGVIEGRKVV